MTIIVTAQQIVLRDRCGVEEAEVLLAAIMEAPGRPVAIEADRVHTALWQVLIAFKPPIAGQPDDAFVMRYVMPLVLESQTAANERSRK